MSKFNWKQYPNMFANGKFKVKYNEQICPLLGTDDMGWNLRIRTDFYQFEEGTFKSVDVCTLIARPISDMTDEEEMEFRRIVSDISVPFAINQLSEKNPFEQDASQLLYLLSIGVYPFSQDHFEDGTVINTNSIKE